MTTTWQGELGRALIRCGVEAAAWVPDKRLSPIADALAAEALPLRTLTRQDECYATQTVRALLRAAPDALYIASLGTPTSALRAASDDGPHLYMGGSMGTALAVALGVAEKRPQRRVVAILGDGELLMGANSLWSFAGLKPPNLLAAVLADGHYSITGGQPLGVPTAFVEVAAALGLTAAAVDSEAAVAGAVAWPGLLEIRCDERDWPGPSPFVDPPVVRWRFEAAAS